MSRFKVHPQRNKIVDVEETKERSTTEESSVINNDLIQKILLPFTVSMQILGVITDYLSRFREYVELESKSREQERDGSEMFN